MNKTVTSIQVMTENEVSDDDKERLMEDKGYESFEAYAQSLEDRVENLLAGRVFADADTIALMNVDVDVEEDIDQNS